MSLGKAIYDMREKLGMNQDTLKTKTGLSQTYLSQIENSRKIPTHQTVEVIAKALEVPPFILYWMGTTEGDIQESKLESFKTLKPSIDALIDEFFIKS
jgi:transcriptional regulator with XRE-family HTH domain